MGILLAAEIVLQQLYQLKSSQHQKIYEHVFFFLLLFLPIVTSAVAGRGYTRVVTSPVSGKRQLPGH